MSKRTELLLKENNAAEMMISTDSQQVLTDIVVYIRAARISTYHQELVRRDICQMLADGEGRGMSANEVIGEDYRAFCDNVIAEMPELSNKTRILTLIRDSLPGFIVLLLIYFAFDLLEQFGGSGSWPYFMVTVGNILSTVLIFLSAFAILYQLSKNSFNTIGGFTNRKLVILLLAVILICVGLNIFGDLPLFKIHVLLVAAGMIALFAAYKILDAKID